jgi:ABC-type hemin transport system ATPase subunit
VEQVLAWEDRIDVARTFNELMQAQYPDRIIVLSEGRLVIERSDGTS